MSEMSVCFTYRRIIVNSAYLSGKYFPRVLLNRACVDGTQDFMDSGRFMRRKRRRGKCTTRETVHEKIHLFSDENWMVNLKVILKNARKNSQIWLERIVLN